MITGATTRFGISARIRTFYVRTIGNGPRASSCPPTGAIPLLTRRVYVSNDALGRSLAHEIGHILLNPGPHSTDVTNIMATTNSSPLGETIDDGQCNRIYGNA
jgi:hypothetical protein